MVKAVEAHADVPWVVLYVKRWLSAPLGAAGDAGCHVTLGRERPSGSILRLSRRQQRWQVPINVFFNVS